MKRLLLLILLLLFVKTNAQNGRWMYLTTSTDSTVYMVDTLTNDNKQLNYSDGHLRVILIWVKTQNSSTKDGSTIKSSITHYVIDTAINQMAIKSLITYKDGSVINNETIDLPQWSDIIPESVAEVFITYCRALHDKKLMLELIKNSSMHDILSLSKK